MKDFELTAKSDLGIMKQEALNHGLKISVAAREGELFTYEICILIKRLRYWFPRGMY